MADALGTAGLGRYGALLIGLLLFVPDLATSQTAGVSHPLALHAEELVEDLERTRTRYRELEAQGEGELTEEERAVLRVQRRELLHEYLDDIEELIENVTEQEKLGLDPDRFRSEAREVLLRIDAQFEPYLGNLERETKEFREASEALEGEARADAETEIQAREKVIDYLYQQYLAHVHHLQILGLPSEETLQALRARVEARGSELSGRLMLAGERLEDVEKRSNEAPDDADLARIARTARVRVEAISSSLSSLCDVAEDLGSKVADCRQLLIESTGELTDAVLDRDVAWLLIEGWIEKLRAWASESWPRLFGKLTVFVAVLFLFWLLSLVVKRIVRVVVRSGAFDMSELARQIVARTASRAILTIGVFVALSQAGVQIAALLAGLGIAGFIIGFALQDTLGNFASGAMILFYRPYDVGDVIEAGGVSGTVSNMSLVSTTILTFDNQTLVVPNSKIWGDVIRNVTAQTRRRVDLTFPVAHDDDVLAAEELFAEVVRENPKVLRDPEPNIQVHRVTETAVEFIVRPWVDTADYWPVYWEINREVKLRLAERGFRVPASRRIHTGSDEPGVDRPARTRESDAAARGARGRSGSRATGEAHGIGEVSDDN